MRIAFFADSYKPYLSGVTNSAETLVKELRLLGHQVYVFAPSYPGHVDDDPFIFRFPSIASGYPRFRLALPVVAKIPEIDLVHSHSPFQAGLLAGFVARRRRVPLVYTFHTLFTRYVHYARFVPKPLAKMGIVAYLRSFCRRADMIIAPSELARRVLRSWKVEQAIEVVPSGVDFSLLPDNRGELRVRLRKQYHIPANAPVLFYAGRMSREKNLPFLIEGFNKMRKTNGNLQLVLAGGGPFEKALRHHHHKNIILTGEVKYPEILHYYCMGDIFVFSSLTETQGMVLAEAKANRLPVVALFAGGLCGTVRSGIDGYLVSRDQAAFISHVERLLHDQELIRKMSTAAYSDALERLSSTVVAKKIESIYNSLICSVKPETCE